MTAVLGLCLAAVAVAACTAPTSPPGGEPSPVRASTSPAETVGVEKADLYRAREVAGVVERRPARAVRSAWPGTFTPRRGLHTGSVVSTGARVGVVRSCTTSGTSAAGATTAGVSTAGSGTAGSGTPEVGSAAAPTTGPDPAAATCRVAWHVVRAPVAGTITALTAAEVADGATIARIRPPGYLIRATVTDPAALYDLMRPPRTAKTRVVGGPAGFTVRFERRVYTPADGSVVLVLAVPDDIAVVEGLSTSTAFVVSRRSAVPTLPVTAVQGTTGTGQVVVVGGRRPVVTSVELGQHDGSRVEVTGLPPGARVLRYPLASDFLAAP